MLYSTRNFRRKERSFDFITSNELITFWYWIFDNVKHWMWCVS